MSDKAKGRAQAKAELELRGGAGTEFLLYRAEDGGGRIEVRMSGETVWLSLVQMPELFGRDKSVISRHIRNVFSEGELVREAVVAIFATTAADGKTYQVEHFNLDVIISVGYRVHSQQGTQFRIWATQQLRDYLVKGFLLDDARFKAGSGGVYFDQLLARIRDIRSSEKVFWRKVLDIYATSIDYDAKNDLSKQFFATVQNNMHWAVHGHTAAEVIVARADAAKPNMGLTGWEGAHPRRQDVEIAKNYLGAEELDALNRIVNLYLEFAEGHPEGAVAETVHAVGSGTGQGGSRPCGPHRTSWIESRCMRDMRVVRYGSATIPFRVSRTPGDQSRLRIHVEPDGAVTVVAPFGASDLSIANAVKRRAAWIWKHMQARTSASGTMERQWVSGESCRYLGRRYVLKIHRDRTQADTVRLAGGQLRVWTSSTEPQQVRGLVEHWYRERAAEWIRARVAELSRPLPWVHDAPPVALRQMRKRWGSCSPAGRLTLNPILIRAPREAVDYVILHELCHLRYHDHSARFYRLLGRYVPGWREIKQRLDASADGLFKEAGWWPRAVF